nr:methyl-accepting chemotaxis protein [uncultured Carboxylicivirga sp.]
MKLPRLSIRFNLNDVKVSKRLIISFSVLIVLMFVVGAFSVLTIRSTEEGAEIQAYIENAISDVRVINEHNIAYRYDRNDYRPDIIRDKVGNGVWVLDQLQSYVPESIQARFDSAYTDLFSLTEFTEDYFQSALTYDSLANLGIDQEAELIAYYEDSSLPFSQKRAAFQALELLHLELVKHLLHQGMIKDFSPIDQSLEVITEQVNSTHPDEQAFAMVSDLKNTIDQFKTIHEHTGWVNWKIENVSFNAITNIDTMSTRFKTYLSDEMKRNILIIVLTIVFSLLFAGGIAYTLIRSINLGLQEVIEIAGQIAKGNLSLDALNKSKVRKDEFGVLKQEFALMLQSLRKNVNSLLEMSSVLESTGDALLQSAQHISNNATGQAASVEEISATLDEIAVDIESSAENASKTKQLSNESMQFVEKIAERNRLMIDKSVQIESESEIVTQIAFQTNILALNAAVEAAIAGVAGRAFGVVATQVKELANTSKKAADRIINLSKEGVESSTEGGEMVNKVLPSLQQIDEKIDEVAFATNEQRYKSQQIIKALQNLNDLSQVNATQSEELSASSEELKDHAIQLKQQVDFFTL